MSLYTRVRPVLFSLPPETAHELGKKTMRASQQFGVTRRLVRKQFRYRHPKLQVERFGLTFPTPVGVAAGFDKDGEVTHTLADLGFGFTEVGTVTPFPQDGNPRPRLFRLREDDGMINRLAFNGQGADRVARRLEADGRPDVPVSVNVGKMNDSDAEDAIDDYRYVFETLYDHADYFVVNVSCPNTPEEYDEQSPEHLEAIFSTLDDANDDDKPVLVKVGPDSRADDLADLVDIVHDFDVSGIVATNTTTDHSGLQSEDADEWGGVSGEPLEERATETVRTLAGLTDLPIVGVGGVRDAESAYRKIRAGASLVQLYTGFVYNGPRTAYDINTGLVELLDRDGFDSIEEAVGVDV
ncbi:quinone-dependent dihydroorotate dehydrogenase [Haloarchaeobius sp. HRN-SO-5]|uniref:quinone-dependent dihydroorotate dehydrogenase n=1 Tax=Haloarchaeobius sp. HRN-SO-5 TaxID=3446118 RepID=UPI003EBEBE3E